MKLIITICILTLPATCVAQLTPQQQKSLDEYKAMRTQIEAERKVKRQDRQAQREEEKYYKIAMMKSASDRRRYNRDVLDYQRRSYVAACNAAQFGRSIGTTTFYPTGAFYGGCRSNGGCYPSRYSTYSHYR